MDNVGEWNEIVSDIVRSGADTDADAVGVDVRGPLETEIVRCLLVLVSDPNDRVDDSDGVVDASAPLNDGERVADSSGDIALLYDGLVMSEGLSDASLVIVSDGVLVSLCIELMVGDMTVLDGVGAAVMSSRQEAVCANTDTATIISAATSAILNIPCLIMLSTIFFVNTCTSGPLASYETPLTQAVWVCVTLVVQGGSNKHKQFGYGIVTVSSEMSEKN